MFLAGNGMVPGLLERKNNNKVESFSTEFFYVFTHVDNRERARACD